MKISATLSWDEELTDQDKTDFLNAIKWVKILSIDRQMRMNHKTHDIIKTMIMFKESGGDIEISFKDNVISRLNGLKVSIDNRRPDNEVKIY